MSGQGASRLEDAVFGQNNPALIAIWSDLQTWQTKFCYRQELTAYYASPQWHDARRVLDLGTGTGYYLRKIAALFPEKEYLGVDSSREFIAIAQETNDTGIEFGHMDLFDVRGEYDFVIMRLLLQHLPDVEAALDHVAGLTRPGGSALIIDAHDPTRFFWPEVPKFMEFFAAFRDHEARKERRRDVGIDLSRRVDQHSGWKLGSSIQLLIPSTIPDNLDLFRKTYLRVIEMVEEVGEMDFDYEAVKQEWRWWCGLDRAYTQVGLILLRIDRPSAT